MKSWTLSTVFLLLISTSCAASSFYKWTDEKGTVHYSSTPPDHTQGIGVVKVNPGRAQPKAITLEAPQENSAQELATQQEAANNKRIAAKNCTLARQNLKELTAKARIRLKQADGSFRMLPHEERQEKIDSAKTAIADFCDQ